MARVLVFANVKGGTGKTTLALHMAVGLHYRGHNVAVLDLDSGQESLSRYIENRQQPGAAGVGPQPGPKALAMPEDILLRDVETQEQELANLLAALSDHDIVVIDSPGSDAPLGRAALAHADCLVSPVNESLIDVNALAALDPGERTVKGPSRFTQSVWEASNNRVIAGLGPLQWIVVKNRVPHMHSRNRDAVDYLLRELAWRLRYELGPEISERVIYRELFLYGLTVLDLSVQDVEMKSPSHLAAKNEMDALLDLMEARVTAARETPDSPSPVSSVGAQRSAP
jgi:chromosome partitioning protein